MEYKRLVTLQKKVENCLNAAALSSGCKVNFEWTYVRAWYSEERKALTIHQTYKDLRNNSALGDTYIQYMKTQGVDVPIGTEALGSTDFGDVSYEVPSLHPMFKASDQRSWNDPQLTLEQIPGTGAGNGNHTPGFTDAARTKEAHEDALRSAKGMAVAAFRAVVVSAHVYIESPYV